MFNYSALPDWYDWAYALSEAGLLLISLLATLFIGVLASLVVALYRGRPGRAKPSSMPPGFLTGIVLPVSVVLGLLVNDVWRKYDDAHDVVLQEAAIVADLVRVNVYITHLDQEKLATWRTTRDRVVDAPEPSASTVIGVYSLFNGSTIEIDAIAAV